MTVRHASEFAEFLLHPIRLLAASLHLDRKCEQLRRHVLTPEFFSKIRMILDCPEERPKLLNR